VKYNQETYEVIRQRMLNNMANDIDKREGSFVSNMVSPVGVEFAKYYIELDNILSIMFLEDATNEFLDKKVYDFGIERKQGAYARGYIKITGENGTFIPQHSEVLSQGGLVFFTLEDVWIENEFVVVEVEASKVGTEYNLIPNMIDKFKVEIQGVTSVTNEEEFAEGADVETDEELRERFFEIIRRPATSGNIYHYEQWAKEVDGINEARVKPLWNGNGTVKVIVSNDNNIVDEEIVQKCQERINNVRPIGADVTVITPSPLDIRISANIYIENGYSADEAKFAFESNLRKYLKSCEGTVIYTRVASCLGSVEGIKDYSDLKVNDDIVNISYDDEKLPILKSIALSEVV
jgi:uncharacterized phage protein gp47/JayE